ncbi:hypothetical protein NUSPORA_03022 [Nucleospora cyclopteri]
MRIPKNFTYYSIIVEAIYSYSERKATALQIFNYVVAKHPDIFTTSNSMTWKGNIRQLLSKNPEFVKLKRNENSKMNLWTHKPLYIIKQEENRLNECLMDKKEHFSFYEEEEIDPYVELYYKHLENKHNKL